MNGYSRPWSADVPRAYNLCLHEKPRWCELVARPNAYQQLQIDQKVDYPHNNPIADGFVEEAHRWKYSSAIYYCGTKEVVEVCLV